MVVVFFIEVQDRDDQARLECVINGNRFQFFDASELCTIAQLPYAKSKLKDVQEWLETAQGATANACQS